MDLMQLGDTQTVIFDRGCLRSGEEWVERNLIPVAGVAVALAVLQVCLHFKYSVHFTNCWFCSNDQMGTSFSFIPKLLNKNSRKLVTHWLLQLKSLKLNVGKSK